MRRSLRRGLLGDGCEIWIFFLVGDGREVNRLCSGGGFEFSLCDMSLLQLLLIVFGVVGRERGRHFVMDSPHAISLGHHAAPMSSGVKTTCNDGCNDQDSEDDGEGDHENQVGWFLWTWLCG